MEMNLDHWWVDIDWGKPKLREENNLSQCHFVHHKFHIDWPGIEPWPPRWEARVRSWISLVGYVVDKVAVGHVFRRVLRFSPVSYIPPVLRYLEKRKKKRIIFITGLHNKP